MRLIKDRVLDFRGLKAVWSAHTTIDDVPCDRARVSLELGESIWLDLIKLSSF